MAQKRSGTAGLDCPVVIKLRVFDNLYKTFSCLDPLCKSYISIVVSVIYLFIYYLLGVV